MGTLGHWREGWQIDRGCELSTEHVYNRLFVELVSGYLTPEITSCLFTYKECEWIVKLLEIMKDQLTKYLKANEGQWPEHEVGEFPESWSRLEWN